MGRQCLRGREVGGGGGVGTLRNTGRRNDNMRPYPSCAEDGRGTRSAWCAAASSNAPRWIRPGGWQRGAVDLRHRSLNHKLCMAGGGEGGPSGREGGGEGYLWMWWDMRWDGRRFVGRE